MKRADPQRVKRADLQLVTRATTAGKSGPTAGERADLQLVRKSMQRDLDSMMVDSQRTRTSSCVTKVART